MAELIAIANQTVALNSAISFILANTCRNNDIFFDNGSGVLVLRGIVPDPRIPAVRYNIEFNGNIAIPEGGTAGPIAVGVAINGETFQPGVGETTPQATDEYNNVSSSASIIVPRGSTFFASVRAVAPLTTDTTETPAPFILVKNGVLTVDRFLFA